MQSLHLVLLFDPIYSIVLFLTVSVSMAKQDQHQAPPPVCPPPMMAYPPPEHAYTAPPPPGYPGNNGGDSPYKPPVPVEMKSRGDGFWKGCCAALCCCCVLDMCF